VDNDQKVGIGALKLIHHLQGVGGVPDHLLRSQHFQAALLQGFPGCAEKIFPAFPTAFEVIGYRHQSNFWL